MKPIWDRLTFTGLQRYVMICDCVFNSDEYFDLVHGEWFRIEECHVNESNHA